MRYNVPGGDTTPTHPPIVPLTNNQVCPIVSLANSCGRILHTPCAQTCRNFSGVRLEAGLLDCGICTSLTLLVIAKLLSKVVVQMIILKYKLNHVTSLLKLSNSFRLHLE